MEPGGAFHDWGSREQHTTQISTQEAGTDRRSVTGRHRVLPSTRKSRQSKSRSDRWKVSRDSKHLKDKYRAFTTGYARFKHRIRPSHLDLLHATHHEPAKPGDSAHYYEPNMGNLPDHTVTLARSHESREMSRMIELLEDGGVGFLPEKKEIGFVRIMFENWNSLGVFTQSWKMDRLNYLSRRLKVDIVAGCESQCNWSMVDPDHQFLSLLAPGIATKGIAAHNRHEKIQRDQAGGTAIAGIGRICDIISEKGMDTSGLGRWSWLKLGTGLNVTRVISAYLPQKPGRNARGRTVWEQQSRYFEARGDMRYPSTIFVEDLLCLLQQWIQNGEHILLAMDANQDVYKGHLALRLQKGPFNMTCMMEDAIGEKVPNSHFSGTRSISTIFGTPGIVTGNAMCYPHWYGIGDHRILLLEFSAKAAFNGTFPAIATPSARSLNCKISRITRRYCTKLQQLTESHKMIERLAKLEGIHGESYTLAHNRWDSELGEYMRCAERASTDGCSGTICFSPTVGQWLKKRSILKWILRWHDGKVPDVRNLLRAARRHQMDNPLSLSKEDVEARLVACMSEIYTIKMQAPALRSKHLQWRLNLAKKRDDEVAEKEITRIIRNEARRRRQCRINYHVKDPKGRPVLRVTAHSAGGEIHYDTQEQVENQVQLNLQTRFSLGKRAPIHNSPLLQDFGLIGDTEAAERLFKGEYHFPPGSDEATMSFLREAARLRLEMSELPQDTPDITVSDYIDFWSTAKEATASSKSGRHFGHYKAVCTHPGLVNLHVKSINLAAQRGNPLVRWRQGVTVLLEKIAGDISIDKLRAICLLEADFNWWLKVIFARKMIARMRSHGVIPLEQGAVKGKMATDTSLMKQLFLDQANILHEDCAITSTDAANCYDAGNHTATGLSLQAMGIHMNFISCYLKCVQLMRYFLQTGFGLSETSYGGTSDSVCMGLIQGSGAAPGVWTAVSTVILGAYKAKGYGAYLSSGWSGTKVPISALLYVDDTDLLHRPHHKFGSQEELISWIQEATKCWAYLLQATGGSLKPAKCYWYLMEYKFKEGTAYLSRTQDIRHISLNIPQPDTTDVTIELKDTTEATKVLGVMCCPNGDGTPMLNHMLGKGYKWSSRVLSSPLPPHDAWFSFHTQAIMSVRYGIIPLMAHRAQIDDALGRWYYHCLPALGVNRHITKGWRMLPVGFQGLGLPNLSLEKLSDSLKLLQRHWGTHNDLGASLRCSFELVQMETGLYGNFLLRDFTSFGCLATHSWFKCLWELTDHYQVKVELSDQIVVPPLRERDKVLMEEVIHFLPPSQWVSFNRARKYFQVYFMSQLLLSDGKTVDPTTVTLGSNRATSFKFPREEPTPQDIELWISTIKVLTSPSLALSPPLGEFLRHCIESDRWRMPRSQHCIVHTSRTGHYDIFQPILATTRTRHSVRFAYAYSTTTPPASDLSASVTLLTDGTISLHSYTSFRVAELTHHKSFLERLTAGSQSRLWDSLVIDDNGDWIPTAALNESLVMVHDGSYMPELDPSICSAALAILCLQTGKMGRLKMCEKTDPSSATNYRAEIIGGLLASHVLHTIDSILPVSKTRVHIYCDNLGVVNHAQHPHRPLHEKQAQSDVLTVFLQNLHRTRIQWEYHHVYGHLDDTTSFHSLTIPQQLNVITDCMAKEAIREAKRMNKYCLPLYPNENIRVSIGGRKATSSFRTALYRSWGYQQAKALFHTKGIICSKHFHLVYWDGVHQVMHAMPQMYKVWVTKHVSGFCGTNKQLSRMDNSIANKCRCCGRRNEDKLHITRCSNPGRTMLFLHTVTELIEWMQCSNGDMDLILVTRAYLKLRGKTTMRRLCNTFPHLHEMACDFDRLGWENFIEGRICTSFFLLQQKWLTQSGSRWTISAWSRQFLAKILNITHRQWLYRNARIHIRVAEDLTEPDHDLIMEQVSTLMGTDPMDLLPCHRHLLDWNFDELGTGPTLDRQYWIAQMDSAIKAKGRKRSHEDIGHTSTDRNRIPKRFKKSVNH